MLRARVLARTVSTTAAATWSFGCTLCGRCCTLGNDRVVLVSEQEVAALQRDTGLPPSAFVKPTSEGLSSLLTRADGTCVFLKGKKCTVYATRPTQCRTYPFWGEITTPLGWLRESARCPGITVGHGFATPHAEVALDVVQTDLALAGESTTYEEDRILLEAIPDLVAQQFEEQQNLGGRVRWDTPELCVVDSPDPQTGRELRTLVLKDAPSLSQSVAFRRSEGDSVSALELAMPVHQALALSLSFARATPERILVVGGGGCGLPLAFATALPRAHVTVVELSHGVADAARRLFIADAPRNLELVVADGADFLRVSSETYDLIVVDAADALNSPAPPLATEVFLDTLHAKLAAHGSVAINCFGDAAATFVSRVAKRFGRGAAGIELKAEDAVSVHTIVFAQSGWTHGCAADVWRARLEGCDVRLCGADAARHAMENLRTLTS